MSICIYIYMNVYGNIYVYHSEIIEDKTDSIRVLEVFKFLDHILVDDKVCIKSPL